MNRLHVALPLYRIELIHVLPPISNAQHGKDPLVSSFTNAGVRAVLAELNCRSAPGPDGITNELLKNLADKDIDLLTKHINEV